jgi:DNA-binding NarL/FixJ family response regulator
MGRITDLVSGDEHRITVGIVDDHELVLESMASWLAEYAHECDVRMTATSWNQCLTQEQFPPRVLIMDYALGDDVSIEARVLTCRAAGAEVIVVSAYLTPELEQRCLSAGAARCVSKSSSMTAIRQAVSETVGVPLPGASSPSNSSVVTDRDTPRGVRVRLSPSEARALVLYSQGLAMGEIANAMNVQFETAKTFIRRVREKYARAGRPASQRAELVRRAAEDGYLT